MSTGIFNQCGCNVNTGGFSLQGCQQSEMQSNTWGGGRALGSIILSQILSFDPGGSLSNQMNCEGILQTKANNNISGFLLVDLLCFKDRMVMTVRYIFSIFLSHICLLSHQVKVSYLYCSLRAPQTPRGTSQ